MKELILIAVIIILIYLIVTQKETFSDEDPQTDRQCSDASLREAMTDYIFNSPKSIR